MFRPENPVSGDLHHAVVHGCATKNPQRCHTDDDLEWSSLGSDGRIEEVDRIVADTHNQVEYSKDEKKYDNGGKDKTH